MQQHQNKQVQDLLMQYQLHTLAVILPQQEVPTFSGDPIAYCNFIQALENLIEAKTQVSVPECITLCIYIRQYVRVNANLFCTTSRAG